MNKLFITFMLLFQSAISFAASENGHWQAGIGDPSLFGWLTVLVYLAAVWRCLVKAKQSKKFGGNYLFWVYLAVFLLLLGINKQLDLQSWFTEIIRNSSKAHGWYAQRRLIQVVFIAALGLGMLIALFSVRLFLANSWRRYKLTWLGIIALCAFILIRAASFHHMDVLINHDIFGIKMNVLLEISAIFLIILGTFFSKKFVQAPAENGDALKEYVEIREDGDDVRCPRCGVQPLSKPLDGRLFKCRSCSYKYRVIVQNS